jgi:hypothetical protein
MINIPYESVGVTPYETLRLSFVCGRLGTMMMRLRIAFTGKTSEIRVGVKKVKKRSKISHTIFIFMSLESTQLVSQSVCLFVCLFVSEPTFDIR